MASTTAVNSFRKSGSPVGNGVLARVKAAETIIKGCMTKWASGLLINGADAAGRFAGIAMETVTGATGDVTMTSIRTKGIYAFAMTGGSAAADIGQLATMIDNNTIGLAGDSTNDEIVGLIVGADTPTGAWGTSADKLLVDIGIRA